MSSEKKAVKSALDVALQRFGPLPDSPTMTSEQKQELADIDKSYQAHVAEKEVVFEERIRNALRAGEFPRAEAIRQEKAKELRQLRDRMEKDKEAVRAGS